MADYCEGTGRNPRDLKKWPGLGVYGHCVWCWRWHRLKGFNGGTPWLASLPPHRPRAERASA